MSKILRVAVLLCAAHAAVAAQGTGSGVVASLATSPRALALADVGVDRDANAWSLFVAPGQLGTLNTLHTSAATESYLGGTLLSALAVALPRFGGVVAVGASVLDYGTISEIASLVPGGEASPTGRRYGAQDNLISVAYARTVARTQVAIVGEHISVRIADASASAGALSFGAARALNERWHASVALQHVGPALSVGVTENNLPLTARVGVARSAYHLRGVELAPVAELRQVRGSGVSAGIGVEAVRRNVAGAAVAIRLGYAMRESSDRAPVSGGFGVELGRWGVDYAVQRFALVDQVTHRVGLRFRRPSR
ncbi:MAG: hypothetical protein FJ202_01135 [Gemmatimonadetes bacterium]|nr:hypothetical protein [Gemmatimonadota bacterium]